MEYTCTFLHTHRYMPALSLPPLPWQQPPSNSGLAAEYAPQTTTQDALLVGPPPHSLPPRQAWNCGFQSHLLGSAASRVLGAGLSPGSGQVPPSRASERQGLYPDSRNCERDRAPGLNFQGQLFGLLWKSNSVWGCDGARAGCLPLPQSQGPWAAGKSPLRLSVLSISDASGSRASPPPWRPTATESPHPFSGCENMVAFLKK